MTARIPVEEMIPDDGTTVLCWGWLVDDTAFEAWLAYYEKGYWRLIGNNRPVRIVTHWFPIR